MPSSKTDPTDLLPLTPVAFDILLALLDSEAHGYAIMQAVQERTSGATSLHAGTLYRALSRLVDSELIEELDELPSHASDERRRYYRVTGLGRRVAAAEARRLESQLGAARAHGLLGST
jgi:DNA-binding PadR family transcriptional regulator